MKIYLVNNCFTDANWKHYGCRAVIDSISYRILNAGHTITHICNRPNGPTLPGILDSDTLIINGEGTFRDEDKGHEPGRIERLKQGMILAKEYNRKVYLFNTIWCKMRPTGWEILKRLNGISTREIDSQTEIQKLIGTKPEAHIDESFFCPLSEEGTDLTGREVVGEIYTGNMTDGTNKNHPAFKDFAQLSLFEHSWSYVVNSLRGAKIYIAGQHHGVFAAAKAKCPFVACRVNTHKLSGLFKWADVNIPIATNYREISENIIWAYEHPEVYQKFFNWMDNQKPWPIPMW